jgi:hypothetical protein
VQLRLVAKRRCVRVGLFSNGPIAAHCLLSRQPTLHPNNIPPRAPRVVVVESGQNPMGYLLDNKLIIGLTLLPPPKNAVGMAFHVFNVAFGVLVLVVSEFYDEAGSYFPGIHGTETFAIVMPFLICPY